MVNKSKQIICDLTKIILDDNVTLFPGYVEIKDGFLISFGSNDPKNEEAEKKPFILHNRVEYKYETHREPCNDKKLQGKHFISKEAVKDYLTMKK